MLSDAGKWQARSCRAVVPVIGECDQSGALHRPARHVFMPGHLLPQAPQLFLSLLVSTQLPVHWE